MELLSYVATVVGIPFALWTFSMQEKKERQNEQEEIYDKLMDHYAEIQEKLFEYPELDEHDKPLFDPEAARRQSILYEMLVSLFERAYILLESETDPAYRRMWNSWLDYIHIWAGRANFREALPHMMRGEDPHFTLFMAEVTGLDLKP
jgi:SNF2 family DNA or RNA helicase